MGKKTVQLGDRVRDVITGYVGIAIARTEWLNNCVRWTIQSPVGADGKVPDSYSTDEPNVEVIEPVTAPHEPVRTGGPRPTPRLPQL